jgi:V-type H+-transporting ATPase subunit C
MPSDLSYWIISAPLKDGDPGLMLMDVRGAVGDSVEVGQWELPELKVCQVVGDALLVFSEQVEDMQISPVPCLLRRDNADIQTGTLSSLLSLSDALPKLDSQFTQTVSKTLDTLRSLTGDEKLSQHARINDRPVEEALMQWKWDRGRWGDGGKVGEVVEALTKVSSRLATEKV